jgi:hypothetical protein
MHDMLLVHINVSTVCTHVSTFVAFVSSAHMEENVLRYKVSSFHLLSAKCNETFVPCCFHPVMWGQS